MTRLPIAAILAAAIAIPATAQAQSRVVIPDIRIPATVTGHWVLNPRTCPDIREDFYDARVTTSRQDRREDRRDRRVVNCPPSSYEFVPDTGQAPNRPFRVDRHGNLIGEDVRHGYGHGSIGDTYYQPPVRTVPKRWSYETPSYVTPSYTTPAYTTPSYTTPSYTTPSYTTPSYTTPSYTTPSYTTPSYPAPTYSQPAPAPSRYVIRNGQIVFTDNP